MGAVNGVNSLRKYLLLLTPDSSSLLLPFLLMLRNIFPYNFYSELSVEIFILVWVTVVGTWKEFIRGLWNSKA